MAEMEDIWKEAFPVGTEWDQYDKVYEIEWDFSNLDEAFDEGGPLHDKRVYLFGCTEPQLVHWKGKDKVVHVPAVVAVLSPFAPSDKLGIKSVQMETEMIVPMREMKMDWIPYIPDTTGRGSDLRRHRSNIFTLKCIQRRAGLRQMKQERVKKFEYCLPYIFLPHMQEEQEVDTVVSIMYPFEGDNPPPPLLAEYDWEMDEYEEFTDNLVKDESLPEAEKPKFIEYVKKEVKEAKLKAKKEREERKKAIEDMGEERLEALKNLRFLKFYPKHSEDTPDISEFKANYINRYYGKAHELDYASVHAQIKLTTSHIESRYVDCGDDFDGGVSELLSPFIARHGPGGSQEVKVEGVESDGRPARFTFRLHEDELEEFDGPGTHDGCMEVCTEFAEVIVHQLSIGLVTWMGCLGQNCSSQMSTH
ncbi:unnamed protein product [Closterium sp. NIES-64]|nr:unnamed protein product [Closterium sp. NIES-64]